jgi:hypothetical protein
MRRAERFMRVARLLAYLAVASSPHLVWAQDVAYVLEVQGRWYVTQRPAGDLRRGSALRVGDTVAPRQGFEPLDSIVIMGLGERILARRDCQSDCGSPIQIADPRTVADPLAARFVKAVMSLWERDAPKFTVYSGRGAAGRLAEGVVQVAGGRADLAPVLDLPAGTYTLAWRPLREGEGAASSRSVSLAWPSGGTPVPLDLPPGLYEVTAFEGSSPSDDALLSEAWVLVADPGSYPRVSRQFDAAVAAARQWGPEIRRETVRMFLRAYLFELAFPPSAGQG